MVDQARALLSSNRSCSRRVRAGLLVPLLWGLAGCGATESKPPDGSETTATPGGDPAGSGPAAGTTTKPERWTGPVATTELEVMESMPEQFAVTLRVQAPSGGYRLRAVGIPLTIRQRPDSGADGAAKPRARMGMRFGKPVRTDVRFELTEPPQGAPAITVIEECSARVELGTEVTFPVRVLLRRVGDEDYLQVGDELVR